MHPSSIARWLSIFCLLLTGWAAAQENPATSKRKPGEVPEQVSPEGAAYLQRLMKNTPFGSERFPSEITWALAPDNELFPKPIDLDALDLQAAKMLRTWFVAHVEIKPHKTTPRRPPSRRRKRDSGDFVQLSLLP